MRHASCNAQLSRAMARAHQKAKKLDLYSTLSAMLSIKAFFKSMATNLLVVDSFCSKAFVIDFLIFAPQSNTIQRSSPVL